MTGMHQGPKCRRPPSLALPSPALKRGTFYFAQKRNFLLCLDTRMLAYFLFRESSMIFDTDIGEKMRAPSGFCIAS